MLYQRSIVRKCAAFALAFLLCALNVVSAQNGGFGVGSALTAGNRVLVMVGRMPVRTAPEFAGGIAAEVLRGMVSRVVAVQQDADGRTWLYLENPAYGWILDTIEGEPTVIAYSDAALEQIASEALNVIRANPTDAQAYVESGTANLSQRIYEGAITEYSTALYFAPEADYLYQYRAQVYIDTGSYDQALADIEAAQEASEINAATYNRAGIVYMQLDNFDSALNAYELALELQPAYALTYSNLGLLYHRFERYDEALDYFSQAIEQDPYLASAYANRALTYQETGHYDEALVDYNAALEIDPYYAYGYVQRARYYAEIRWDRENALNDNNQSIALDPNDGRAYLERARTYVAQGEFDLAVNDLKYADTIAPFNADVNELLGTLYGRLGDYTAAIDSLTWAITMPTAHYYETDALFYRAQMYMALGDYTAALADLENYLTVLDVYDYRNFNLHTGTYLLRGNIYAYLGDYQKAAADYADARLLTTDFVVNYYILGTGLRLTIGREPLLLELQQQTLAQPTNAELHLQFAVVCLEFGQWRAAVENFQRYRELSGVSPDGFESLLAVLETLAGA